MTDQPSLVTVPATDRFSIARIFAFLRERTAHFFREHWESISVDLATFPPLLRLLVRVGYVSIFLLLVATLIHEFVGASFPQVATTFNSLTENQGITGRIPIPVLWISTIAYVVGWAFLLTGATGTRRRVFLPIWAFYMITWVNTQPEPDEISSMLCCGGFVIALLAGIVYTLTSRHPFWRRYSILEFGGWLLLLSFQMTLLLLGNSPEEIVGDLDQIFAGRISVFMGIPFGAMGIFYVTIPFWILLGIDASNGVADLSKALVNSLRQGLSAQWLRIATLPILIGLTLFLFILFILDLPVFFTFLGVMPLVIGVALVLVLIRKWQNRTAFILLWLGITAALYHLFLGFALYGSDLGAIVYEALLPPGFLFVTFLSLDVLTFGKRFAQEDGVILPRSARLLMYFGVALLFGAATLFRLNIRLADGTTDPSFSEVANAFGFVAFLGVGPFLLLWNTWRHRAELFEGVAEAQPQVPLS
jgi:hypothetical protein